MPSLYVIATPIGNLEDVTLRAIRILKEVKLIATEDTRKTRRLLDAYGIKTPTTSYHEHNKLAKLPYLLERLTIEEVALVSEAGMPGISDPGYELVLGAIKQGTPVVPVPGVSAITTAVAVSGLPADRFLYLGFFPARAGARRRFLQEIAVEKATLVAFETPHRLTASLKDLYEILGDRRIAVCRELTKLHEEVFRGTVSQALSHFTSPRGEFTLVIEGNKGLEELKQTADIESRIKEMRRTGKTAKEATSALSEQTGLSRKELYRIWLKQKQA